MSADQHVLDVLAEVAVPPPNVEAAPDPVVLAAARALGMKTSEIASVKETRAGVVVATYGGTPPVIVVPKDKPDRFGRHGVMWLHRPSKSAGQLTPTYDEPDVDDEPPEPVEAPAVDDAPVVPEVPPTLEMDVLAKLIDRYENDPAFRGGGWESNLVIELRRALRYERQRQLADLYVEPPPNEREVRKWVGIAAWAREMLAAGGDADRRRITHRWGHEGGVPEVLGYRTSDTLVSRDLASALSWLESKGLDEHGEPIPDPEPEQKPRWFSWLP